METGIIKQQNDNSENSIIKKALLATQIKHALPYEIDGAINNAIEKAIFFLGLKISEQDRTSIKVIIFDDIKKHFAGLTIAEIGIAIENGSKAKYGEVFGLAPKDVFHWLTEYSASQERIEVKVQLEKESQKPTEPTDEQKAQIAWNNLVLAWRFFKENGYYNDYGNSVYNTLDANGKINFTKYQKLEFKAQALSNLEKQHNPLQYMGNVVKINEARAILDEIRSSDQSTRLVAECKRIALNKFFKNLADVEMEIEDMFETTNFDLA